MKQLRRFANFLVVGTLVLEGGAALGGDATRNLVIRNSQGKADRVAVVVGNSKYPSGALANPRNDATAMADALLRLGFDVELKLDASKADLDSVFKRFSAKADTATVAALFYAGHGIQVGGGNYLVPIDANPQSERDLKREMIKMDDIIDDMGSARVKLVFFDACRDNPLTRSFSRGGSRGMAAPVEATGTLISFATKHGNTAADGQGRHSPYSTALLAALDSPDGIEIEQMLRRVQQSVKQATNGQQEPWRYGSLDGDFFFGAATSAGARVSQEAVDRAVKEAADRATQEATRRAAEQAAKERAELQATLRAQQEASDRATLEATRRANEQAAKERAELQATLRTQQEASDRAVQEAIRRANEQAAKERAELQASMEKMLKEALVRQNAALEAERQARQASGLATSAPTAAPAPRIEPAKPAAPVQLALAEPSRVPSPPTARPTEAEISSLTARAGDEWEYVAKDERFGKTNRLVMRVKAATTGGVLEEILWNGKPAVEWVFQDKPFALGTPNESGFLFAPHWAAHGELNSLMVEGGGGACTSTARSCQINLQMTGSEKITVPAGTFDAVRFEGSLARKYSGSVVMTSTGSLTLWYSRESRRLLKQQAEAYSSSSLNITGSFKETIELSAVRRGP